MLRLIQIHGQLLFDDFALFVKFARIKARIEEHIHDDREKMFKMFGAGFGVKAGVLLAGEGVEVSANAFDGLGNLMRGAAGRAFEEHMLDEMGGAVERFRLEAAAYSNPKANADAGHVRHRRGGDGQAIGKTMDLVPHACSGAALLRPKKEEGQKIVHLAVNFTVYA